MLRYLVVALLLAGCASGPEAAPKDEVEGPAIEPEGDIPEPLPPIHLELDWNGSLSAGAWYCEYIVNNDCGWTSPDAYSADSEWELSPGNFTGVISLSWDAGALTEELVFGMRIKDPSCSECESRYAQEVPGRSPIEFDIADMYALENEQLQLWVYSTYESAAGSVFVAAQTAQEFAVIGNLTIQP